MLLKIFFRFLVICLIFQTNFLPNAVGQTTDAPVMLELGNPLEREITGGEKHDFQVNITAGKYAKIIVEQKGINLFARLTDANGKIVVEVDKNNEKIGEEVVEIYTAVEGLKLMVAARNNESPQAKYKIELIEIRQPTAKEIVLQEARTLVNNAIELWMADKYAEAQPFVERGLAIRQREWGNENFEVAQAFFVLGNIVGDLGNFDNSDKYYERALEIAEKTLGKDNLYISGILNNWGITYKVRGDYLKAEELYLRSLAIKEKLLDANHPQIANLLNNLGTIYSSRGDNQKAAEFYRRALAIREKTFGAEHPQVALSLNNLAGVSDDPIVKEQLYLRALAIREKTLGAEHPDVAQTLYNLGRLSAAAGDYTKAEEFMQRALTIFEKALGKEHQFISYPLNLLGAIYKFQGKYDEAETFLKRAAEIKEKMQSPLHPELGGTLSLLAGVYALKGDIEKAVATQKRANEILEYNTLLNLQIGSEREKLDYLKTLEAVNSDTLNLYFQTAKNSKAARELALTTVLQRKGRVLDALSDSYGALRRRSDRQDQKLFDDLDTATNELIGFVTKGREAKSSDEYALELKKLEEKREVIEDRISRRSSGYYEKSKSVTLEQVQKLIPANAVLIEFVVYRPGSIKLSGFSFSDNKKAYQEPHYAAFVVGANGTTNAQDLGTVREIDALVNRLRYALRDPKSTNVKEIAGVLNEKLMQPLNAFNPNATHLLISADGGLNLIPFETLVDEKNRYLVENHSFTYLTSGRDLIRMQTTRTMNKNKSLIIADPTFGASTNAQTSDSRADTTYFAPLAATISEARVIQTEFPDALLLTGATATETALKQANAPLLLHIATHGFFLEDNLQESEKIQSPLLRSGLALAGANKRDGGAQEDGILTALEASGLNLWGTKMVVLSACDTGLGEVKNGEGVYGLRRAFTLAGTETLVMSLWQVSDYITKELMIDYYKNLKSGMGRGAALRQVQLEMLKNPKRQHPFYWASFIQSGEWANLEGKR